MKQLWCVEFNNYLKSGEPKIFAALGGPQFSIYECTPSGNIKLIMCYADEDVREIDDFMIAYYISSSIYNRFSFACI